MCIFAQDHDGLICTKVNLVIEVGEDSKKAKCYSCSNQEGSTLSG